jgi:hypothetical protein
MPRNAGVPAAVLALLLYAGSDGARAQTAADITEQRAASEDRVRASAMSSSFSLKGRTFTGYGPEFAYDKSFGARFFVSAGLGQAYALTSQLGTLFTEIDASIWYSVVGRFARERRVWRDGGSTFAEYRDDRRGGLRLGIGTQQYFFNTSTGAIPFSGVAGKAMYEAGLRWPFDVALGVEAARLANAADRATATRVFVAVLKSFDD